MKRFFHRKLNIEIETDLSERYSNQINNYNNDISRRESLIKEYINIKASVNLFLKNLTIQPSCTQLISRLDLLINRVETEYNKEEKLKELTDIQKTETEEKREEKAKKHAKLFKTETKYKKEEKAKKPNENADGNGANDIHQLAKKFDSNYIHPYEFYKQLLADCYYLSAMSNFYMEFQTEQSQQNWLEESAKHYAEAIKFELPSTKQTGSPMTHYKGIITTGQSSSDYDELINISIELLYLALTNTFDTHALTPLPSPTSSPRVAPLSPRTPR